MNRSTGEIEEAIVAGKIQPQEFTGPTVPGRIVMLSACELLF